MKEEEIMNTVKEEEFYMMMMKRLKTVQTEQTEQTEQIESYNKKEQQVMVGKQKLHRHHGLNQNDK